MSHIWSEQERIKRKNNKAEHVIIEAHRKDTIRMLSDPRLVLDHRLLLEFQQQQFRKNLIKESMENSFQYLYPYCIYCGTKQGNTSLTFKCKKCKTQNNPPTDRILTEIQKSKLVMTQNDRVNPFTEWFHRWSSPVVF